MAIIHSNDQMVRNGDQYFPFRQNSDLFYLTGIEQEMTVLLLTPGVDPSMRLFIRKPEPKLEIWEGRKLDQETASGISGIETVLWLDELDDVLKKVIKPSVKVYYNPREMGKFKPDYPSRDERLVAGLMEDHPKKEFLMLAPLMTEFRLVKEPEEMDLIRESVRITDSGLERVLGFVKPGVYEYQVEAELTHEFIRHGSTGHAYPPIIASGGNACFLHNIRNDHLCRDGDLLLMDFGAEYANYAADCSRTIPVNGKFTSRQRELYQSTKRVFHYARSMMKPGTTIDELNREVGKMWEDEHQRLGLYTRNELSRQTKEDPLYKKYYPHGTSHFIGLDVHDAGGRQVVLKPGMVLSCEPGIYIPEEGTGLRLENDLFITESGNFDLMEDFPMDPDEIEAKMNHGN
jgi:Xaa-Pro aminopeptidase